MSSRAEACPAARYVTGHDTSTRRPRSRDGTPPPARGGDSREAARRAEIPAQKEIAPEPGPQQGLAGERRPGRGRQSPRAASPGMGGLSQLFGSERPTWTLTSAVMSAVLPAEQRSVTRKGNTSGDRIHHLAGDLRLPSGWSDGCTGGGRVLMQPVNRINRRGLTVPLHNKISGFPAVRDNENYRVWSRAAGVAVDRWLVHGE